MSERNLARVVFTPAELRTIDDAITSIEAILQGKTLHLTPEERRQFGQIAESNKLFVNKAKELMDNYPQFIPNFLDKAEFDRDYESRAVIETRLTRLAHITEQLEDTKIGLDNDNYFNAITFYRNVKFLSAENVAGIKTIYEELKQFFKGGRKKQSAPNTPNPTGDNTPQK